MSGSPVGDRVRAQLAFLLEADRLKRVVRQNTLADGSRRENSAEHSWHLLLIASVLSEHAVEPVDLPRVLRMLALHDLVEIDAGDTFAYGPDATDKLARERVAAGRIFGLLPGGQGEELRRLWEEFEARSTFDARFASAVDRLAPVLLNLASGGAAWRRHAVSVEQVRDRNRVTGEVLPAVWQHVQQLLDDAVEGGDLRP
ncbi:MAG TPA: HD domain-containing protein [Nitriliruptorales bacterium]|nr:HD domain-containing protein [Nitriliruptorales bacterium]